MITKLTSGMKGVLPEGMELEALQRTHSSRPRNPVIADACFKAGYIDSWGRGTLKIWNSCKEAGLPEPDIKEIDGGILVTLYKDKYSMEQLKKLGFSQRQIKAVNYVREKGKITNSDYQQLCEVSERTALRDLDELRNKGILEKKGIKKGSYYKLSSGG
ncbi:MAG: ATP-binding protein [Owenweeksia sp.]|nr:ATP-binding protein [Owenweeksia sp.]